MLTAGPAGAYLNDEINIASSPGHAFAMAYLAVVSGVHRRVLISSWGNASELLSEGGSAAVERLSTDPYFERDVALSSLAGIGMQSLRQRDRELGDEGARAVVVKNRAAGLASDRAAVSRAVADADVLASPLVAYPLRALEVAPECNGAFSLVLADADAAAAESVRAWVHGVAWCADSSSLGQRDLVGLPHLRSAAESVYRQAGVADVRAEIDVFELHDYSADAELIALEALGVCADGEAPGLAVAEALTPGGHAAVSPSGGSLSGEAPFGGSLRKVVEAVRQVAGEAGATQVPDTSRALAQMTTGFAGQFQTVTIVGAER
jgi:hypothetical protein